MIQKPSSRPAVLIISILIAVAAIGFIAKQQHDISQMRQDNEALRTQTKALADDLAQARGTATPETGTPLASGHPGASRPKAKSSHAKAMLAARQQAAAAESGPDAGDRGSTKESDSQARQDPTPSPSSTRKLLEFDRSSVESTANGLTATLHFKNSNATPLGLVSLAIRTEIGSNAKILGFSPVGITSSSEETKELAENGKFAFYQGTVNEATNVTFILTLSEPATLNARGTCGMKHLRVNVQPGAATVERIE
jgi:hypothetical protein